MALIELYPVIADHYAIKAGEEIIEGQFGKLDSTTGELVVCDGSTSELALGICGDTKSTSVSGLPTTNDSSQGAFVNRVSDSFDETKASGRMTLYHSGGKFATNMFVSGLTYNPGDALYVSKGTTPANVGKLTNASADNDSGQVVAYVVRVPGPYDSGVPGLDATLSLSGAGTLSLGSYMELKLNV